MYSYEDPMRAVEHYIKPGREVRATIRELRYPMSNALKGWHREYERRQDGPNFRLHPPRVTSGWKSTHKMLAVSPSDHSTQRLKITLAFTPPKPKPLEITWSIAMGRACCATKSIPSPAGSGVLRLRVGGAI